MNMIKRKSTTPPPQTFDKNSSKNYKLSQKRSVSPNSVSSYQAKKNNNMITSSRSMQTATAAPSTRTSVVSSRNFQQYSQKEKLREKGFSTKDSIGSSKDIPSPPQPPYFGKNNNNSNDKNISPPSMSATNQFESQFLISNQKQFTLPAQENTDMIDFNTLNSKRQIQSTSKKQGKITPTSKMVLQQMSKITQIQRKNQQSKKIQQQQRTSPKQSTSISMAELNQKFFYNPNQTPRKMADYAARRNKSNNMSPIDSQSRNRYTFQLNKRNNTRNIDGLSPSITEASKMLSKSQVNQFFSDIGSSKSSVSNMRSLKNDFSPMHDKRTSPDSKGFKICPRSQTPKERVRDKSLEQSYNLPKQIPNTDYQKQVKSPSPSPSPMKNIQSSEEKIKDLEEKNRALQNILISFQKKNTFLQEQLQKMHDRSKIEKQKTMKQIEMVGQNYRKYADYYKKYLQEKNQFERAQRDIITLHLRVQNANKFLQQICQNGFTTVQSLQGIQHHLRNLRYSSQQAVFEQGILAVDETINQISQGIIQKLAELEKTPLGVSFGERANHLAQQQNRLTLNKLTFKHPTASFGMKNFSQQRQQQQEEFKDEKFQNISEQDFYKRNIPGYVRRNSPDKRNNQSQKKGFEYDDYTQYKKFKEAGGLYTNDQSTRQQSFCPSQIDYPNQRNQERKIFEQRNQQPRYFQSNDQNPSTPVMTSSTPEILSRNPSRAMNPSNSMQNLIMQQQQQQQISVSSSRPALAPPQVLDINNQSSNGSSGYLQQQAFNQNQIVTSKQDQDYPKASGYIFSQQQQKQLHSHDRNNQQMYSKDLRNKSQSLTLSDYYNQVGAAFGGPRPTTPQSVVQNISNAGHGRADTPASSQFNQQQRISITGQQNNRQISLMSTIRALNHQLQQIDQGQKKNAYGIEDSSTCIMKSSSQQQFNNHNNRNSSMQQGGQGTSQLSNSVKQGMDQPRRINEQMTNSEQRRELLKKQTPHFVSQSSNEMNLQDELDQNYQQYNKHNLKGASNRNEGVRLTRVDFADQVIDDISDRKAVDSKKMTRDQSQRNFINEIRDVQRMITSQSTKNFRANNNEGISFPSTVNRRLSGGDVEQQSKSPASQPGSGKQKFQIAVAIYDFNAQREGDLSFKQGQQILILQKKEQHNWWLGTMGHNKEGWFPKNFVKVEPLIPNE